MNLYQEYCYLIKDIREGYVASVIYTPGIEASDFGYLTALYKRGALKYKIRLETPIDQDFIDLCLLHKVPFKTEITLKERLKTWVLKASVKKWIKICAGIVILKTLFSFIAIFGSNYIIKNNPLSNDPFSVASKWKADDASQSLLPGVAPAGWDDLVLDPNTIDQLKQFSEIYSNKQKCLALGAAAKRGIIFYGPPGTGKTHAAKILSQQSGREFFCVSGPDLCAQRFVGSGAKAIRDLFKEVKKGGPATIFIDEIDAVGFSRHAHEYQVNAGVAIQSISELLFQLDCLNTQNDDVLVIAATNRVDVLDRALTRPGRFDSSIYFPLPAKTEIVRLLKMYIGKIQKLQLDDKNIERLAELISDCSGADIKRLSEEADKELTMMEKDNKPNRDPLKTLVKIYHRVKIGSQGAPVGEDVNSTSRKLVSYHEAGHQLLTHILSLSQEKQGKLSPQHYVSIRAGAGFGGLTLTPKISRYDEQIIRDLICITYGGRLGELRAYHEGVVPKSKACDINDKKNLGASSDLSSGLEAAKYLLAFKLTGIKNPGTNELIDVPEIYQYPMHLIHTLYPQKISNEIEKKIVGILREEEERAAALLELNASTHRALAEKLLKQNDMYYDDLEEFYRDKKLVLSAK